MKRNGMKHCSDGPPERIPTHTEAAAMTPSDGAAREVPTGAPLARLAHNDAIAASSLSSKALARYRAYKEVVLAREQDDETILSTLKLFVWDLSEGRTAIH